MTLDISPTFTWNETVWNPAMLGPALWLDAADASTVVESGGAVSQWKDKSGNNYHATQVDPSRYPSYDASGFNSKGAINFDRVSVQHLITPSIVGNGIANNQPLSVIQLIKPGDGYIASDSSFMSSIGTREAGGSWWSFIRNSAKNELGFHGSNQFWTGFNIGTNSVIAIDIVNSSNLSSWANGTQLRSTVIAPFSGAVASPLFIGAGSRLQANESYLGSIMEVIFVTSSILPSVRQKLEGYLAHKWGLEASLPADHPYKNYGPRP